MIEFLIIASLLKISALNNTNITARNYTNNTDLINKHDDATDWIINGLAIGILGAIVLSGIATLFCLRYSRPKETDSEAKEIKHTKVNPPPKVKLKSTDSKPADSIKHVSFSNYVLELKSSDDIKPAFTSIPYDPLLGLIGGQQEYTLTANQQE